MSLSEDDEHQRFLQSANPLHVWMAIDIALSAEPPRQIPDWCLPVIARLAADLTWLAVGVDHRTANDPKKQQRITPAQAKDLAGPVLGLSGPGSANAFAAYAKGQLIRAAALWHPPAVAAELVQRVARLNSLNRAKRDIGDLRRLSPRAKRRRK